MTLYNLLYRISDEKPFFSEGLKSFPAHPARTAMLPSIVHFVSKLRSPGHSIRILEVGSWFGASALAWAEGIKKFHSGNGQVFCCDIWDKLSGLEFIKGAIVAKNTYLQVAYDVFRYNIMVSKLNDIVFPLVGDSTKTLQALRDGFFDVVYVDGHHGYGYVRSDLREAKRLVSEGGVICGDDLELQMDDVDECALQAQKDFDDGYDPFSQSHFHPGVTLAVHEEFGKIQPFIGLWAVQKDGETFGTVDLDQLPRSIPDFFPVDVAQQARTVLFGEADQVSSDIGQEAIKVRADAKRRAADVCLQCFFSLMRFRPLRPFLTMIYDRFRRRFSG